MVSVSSLVAMPMGLDDENFQEVHYRGKRRVQKHEKYIKKNPKHSSKKKENRKPRSTSRANKRRIKTGAQQITDEAYDIAGDETIMVAEERDFPGEALLNARVVMAVLLQDALNHEAEDLDALFDTLYEQQFEGLEGVHYVGIVGDFLTAFRSGLDLLTTVFTPFEAVNGYATHVFVENLRSLRASITQAEHPRWDFLLFRLDAFLEHVEELIRSKRLGFTQMLALLNMLNGHFIMYLEQMFQEVPVSPEEFYFLPEGLLDLTDEAVVVDVFPELTQARSLLTVALHPGVFGATTSGWGVL